MSIIWTPEMEVSLFYAMIDHKPVGENKHFHMIFIYEKFNNLSDKKLSIEQIWEHLNYLYDLQALDENEIMAFPSDEVDFSLPEIDAAAINNISDDSESSVKVSSTSSLNSNKNENIINTPVANTNTSSYTTSSSSNTATTTTTTPANTKSAKGAQHTPTSNRSNLDKSNTKSSQSKKTR